MLKEEKKCLGIYAIIVTVFSIGILFDIIPIVVFGAISVLAYSLYNAFIMKGKEND